MPIIKLNNIEIYYELQGQGEPVVLIAGYTCDHQFWTNMLSTLARHFTVLIFDNRAIGQTVDVGNYFTLETMADDTLNLIQALGLNCPYVIGQSMGGAIAQILAIKYPEQIKKLILLNTVMQFNIATLMALESLLALRKLTIPFDDIITATLPWVFSSHYLTPQNIEMFKASIANNPYPQSIQDQERQLKALKSFDASSELAYIRTPALILAAEHDVLTPLCESRKLAESINNALYNVISGGHASPVEQPDKLNHLILNFLNN